MVRKALKKLSLLMAVVMAVTLFPGYALPVRADDDVLVQAAEQVVYSTLDEAATYLKEQMIARNESITVRISTSAVTNVKTLGNDILNKAYAFKKGDSGQAGDALRLWKSCSVRYSQTSTSYKITYTFRYYTTAEQEAELTQAVNNALAGLNLAGKTDYEKIKSIHDYICDNVDYDYEGLEDSTNTIKYTAYSALIYGKAVCNGYTMLFYRMCMDAGIPTRIITGYGKDDAHAWNIVELDGYYYNIDTTWDGQSSVTKQTYFLKCTGDFPYHTRDEEYLTEEFNTAFPMAETPYVDYSLLAGPLEAENYNYTFTTIDGAQASTAASARPKVLVFFSDRNDNCRTMAKMISGSDFSDVDIIYIDALSTSSVQDAKDFQRFYAKNNKNVCSYTDSADTAMWKYAENIPGTTGDIYWPVIAYIDSDNKLQMVTEEEFGVGTMRGYINYYCYGISDISHEHTPGGWIIDRPATVTTEGSRHIECTRCGYVMQSESIPKLGGADLNGLAPADDGNWYCYVNGEVATGYTGLYNDAVYGWWLVVNGMIDKSYTGLYNDVNCGWWLVAEGRVAFEYNDLYNDANCGWWLITNGAVNFAYTGLFNSPTCGWWLIGGGSVAFYYNDLWNDANCGWWLVTGGAVSFGYLGLYYSPTCGWWLIDDGSVAFYYTDWWDDAVYGTWYINGGAVDFSYTA